MPDLLLELFSEEIPARMQGKAAKDLQRLVTDGLVENGLTYAGAASFATPRRLALAIGGLTDGSKSTKEERKGPKVGAPDKAVEGFLRGVGLTKDQLDVRTVGNAEVYFATIEKPGRAAEDIIGEVVLKTIQSFPWPKSMRWGTAPLRWVRPLRNILCVLTREDGSSVIPVDLPGFISNDKTYGHRFMGPNEVSVSSFEDYSAQLKHQFVILDPQERADTIWQDATNQAFAQGLEVVEDDGLLKEVAGLVEWPVVLMGSIDESFLSLPPEVLRTSMKEHQKFFSVRNPKTRRIEKFITVANIETPDNGATILAGNQKVLFARLSDAKFFWENDLRVAKAGMKIWLEALENVTFHSKLGSEGDRIKRISSLSQDLAITTRADQNEVLQAAQIAKADLSSEMVYEFPELQGLMGRYYSTQAGFSPAVAAASEEHYSPLGPSDDVPTAPVSVTIALADKLDKLAGFWAIDEKPTGSKDPFALRRAALGVIRLLVENDLALPLLAVIGKADKRADAANLLSFLHDRLKVYLREQGIGHDVIDACLAGEGSDDLNRLIKRAKALNYALQTEDGTNLVQGFKRANNILTQAEEKDGVEYSFGADPKFAKDDAEKSLFAALEHADGAIKPALATDDFANAMIAMAGLRAPIDAFFEAVQVNSDNEIIRRNRLNLLSRIRATIGSVADLSQIEG